MLFTSSLPDRGDISTIQLLVVYPVISGCYLSGRQVVGLEVILGGLAGSGSQQKQLNKFRVLDAGTGAVVQIFHEMKGARE